MDVRLGGGQLVSEELMTLGESLSQTSDPSLKLFQCAVCNRFTTDNLEILGLHMSAERSLPEEEWRAVVGDSHQCKLCHYTTQLKANFQLHCKTDKHVQKYQLVAHIKEGGKGNEWRLKCVAIGNPVHLKCNACDYYTNSLEKLRMHTVNSRHEASLKLYKVSDSGSPILTKHHAYKFQVIFLSILKAKMLIKTEISQKKMVPIRFHCGWSYPVQHDNKMPHSLFWEVRTETLINMEEGSIFLVRTQCYTIHRF